MPTSAKSSAKQKRKRCAYSEGRRRCSFDGLGDPPLCRPHQIAVAEAARPKSPFEIITGALSNLLSGTPINAEATIGAGISLFEQWKMGGSIGAGHFQGQRIQWDPSWIPGSSGGAARGRPHAPHQPPQEDPRIEIERKARRILKFGPDDDLTVDLIKDARRRLAKKYHPDVAGGSAAKMAAVNDAADVLIAALSAR